MRMTNAWWLTMLVAGMSAVFLLTLNGCQRRAQEVETPIETGEPVEVGEATEAPTEVAKAPEEMTYYCPMHEDVTQDKPGKCPKCGMFLEAKVPEGTKVVYYCPMQCDPNFQSDKPGKCPKCGMFLEAKVVEGEKEAE